MLNALVYLCKEANKEVQYPWAKFFYEANIPFIVSKNKVFREAVKKIVDFL